MRGDSGRSDKHQSCSPFPPSGADANTYPSIARPRRSRGVHQRGGDPVLQTCHFLAARVEWRLKTDQSAAKFLEVEETFDGMAERVPGVIQRLRRLHKELGIRT